MKPAEDIKRIIKNVNIKTNPAVNEAVFKSLVGELEKIKETSSTDKPRVWGMIMKSKITKLAVAAGIILAVILGLHYFGGSIDGTSPAFANVLQEIKKVKSVYYKISSTFGNAPPFTTEEMINENGVKRMVFESGNAAILDFRNGFTLQLDPKRKSAFRSSQVPWPEAKVFNSLDFLATQHEKHARYMGREIIDGLETDLYKDEQPLNFCCTSIWVNPQTNLPVRVVSETIPPTDSNYLPIKNLSLYSKDFGDNNNVSCSLRLSGSCTPLYTKQIMTDFRWNVDLDPTLFATDIPTNYVEQHEIKMPEPNESHLVQVLEFWSETSELLPLDVNNLMDPNIIKPMLIKKFAKGQNPREEYNEASDFMEILRCAAVFAEKRIIKGNWHASREPIFLGDADKPLYWWKNENSDNYCVIYGDLNIKELTPENFPKH